VKNYPCTKNIISYLNDQNADIKIMLQTGSSSIEKIVNLIPLIDGLSYSVDISSSPKVKNVKNLAKINNECQKYSVITQIQTILDKVDKPEDILEFLKLCHSHEMGWIGIEYPQYQRYSKNDLNHQIATYLKIIDFSDDFPELKIGGAIIESACDYIHKKSYSSPCMCGERSITVQPDGKVTPSLHTSLSEEYSFDEFIRLKENRGLRLKYGICSDCQFWGVCHGGCMSHARFITGDALNRDEEYCYVLSNVLTNLK